MALTQEQLDNLVTLLKSEDFEYVQQGITLVDTLVEAGTIGEDEFKKLLGMVTDSLILNDAQYAEWVEKLNTIFQFLNRESSERSVERNCSCIGTLIEQNVLYEVALEDLLDLFHEHPSGGFWGEVESLSLWSLGILSRWNTSLQSLTEVEMEDVYCLPNSMKDLINLTTLKIESGPKVLPEWIGNLTGLVHLYIGESDLTCLPENIGKLTNLKHLSLSAGELTTLPESIGDLTQLTHLTMIGSGLASLPDSFTKLTNLTELDLNECRLKGLPTKIGNLTNLTNLNLNDNRLSILPDSFTDLTNLTGLDLAYNGLTSLPNNIGNLTNLDLFYVDLSYNDFSEAEQSRIYSELGELGSHIRI